MTEYEERLERIKRLAEERRKRPLIHMGWVCDDPTVEKVWFLGYTTTRKEDDCHLRFEILFKTGARHAILESDVAGLEGGLDELMVMKADEYLRNGGKGTMYQFVDSENHE